MVRALEARTGGIGDDPTGNFAEITIAGVYDVATRPGRRDEGRMMKLSCRFGCQGVREIGLTAGRWNSLAAH